MTNTRLGQGTRLERDYGRALGWYPTRWRRTHGPAMLGTLLDVADDEGRNRPAHGELAELRWQGVRERVNTVVPGDVRALAASIGTGSMAGFALVYLVWVSWGPWDARPLAPNQYDTFGPFWNAGVLFSVPFLLGALAAVAGSRAAAHLFVLVGLVALPIVTVMVRADVGQPGPRSTTLGAALLLGLVALLGDPRDRRALLSTFAVVGGGLVFYAVWLPPTGNSWRLVTVGDGGFWGSVAAPWMTASAGVTVAVAVVVLLVRRRPVPAAALALAWLPWGAATTVTLRFFADEPADAVVVAAVSVALAVGAVAAAARRPTRRRREQA